MATDVDNRSSGNGHAGDWSADAMALSFAQASSAAAGTSTETVRWPVLVCPDGLLRRRTATAVSAMMRLSGRGAWKQRRLVLLLSLRARLPTTTRGGDPGFSGRDDTVPMLLMYRVERGDAALDLPTGIIRLDGGSGTSAFGDGGTRPRLSFERVEGHPRHLEVRLNLPSNDSLGRAFVGSDAPRRRKKKDRRSYRHENVEAPGVDVLSWRLKFPDVETATQWATTMRRLAEPTTTMAATAAADDVISAVGADIGDHTSSSPAGGGLGTRRENSSGAVEFTDEAPVTTAVSGRCDGRAMTNLPPPTVVPAAAPPSPARNENDAEEAEVTLTESSASTPASPAIAAPLSAARDGPPPESESVSDDTPASSLSLRLRLLMNSWSLSSASSRRGGDQVGRLENNDEGQVQNRIGGDDDDEASSSSSSPASTALPGLAPVTPTRGRADDEDGSEPDDGGSRDEEGVVIVPSHAPPQMSDSVGDGGGDDIDGGVVVEHSDNVDGDGLRDSERGGRFLTVVIATAIFFCASVGLLVESGVTAWWVDEMAAAFIVFAILLPWGWLALLLVRGPRRSGRAAVGGGNTSGIVSGFAAFVREIGEWFWRVIILSVLLPPLAIITSIGMPAAIVLFLSGDRKHGMSGRNTDPMAFLEGNTSLPDPDVVPPAADNGVHFAPFANDVIYGAMRNLTIVFKVAAMDAVHPAGSCLGDKDTPEFRRTPWRIGLSLVGHALGPKGPFPPGSFVRTYLWMILPISAVWAVSFSSIVCRYFPRLGLALSSRRGYWIPAVAFGSVGILLGHDAWVNHWSRPVRYGLYWSGYLRSMVAMGYLGVCRSFVERGVLGRRSTVSPARRVSGGVSLCLTALSVPLALRSMHERFRVRIDDGAPLPSCSPASSLPSSNASVLYGALAFMAFFVGLYFFGRARRTMTMFGIPVGEIIHGFSMLPANTAYFILGVADDALHVVLEMARRQGLRLARGVLMPVARASVRCLRRALSVVERLVHEVLMPFVRASIRCLHRALCVVERFGRDMVDVAIVVVQSAGDVIIALWRGALVPALQGFITVCANVVRMMHRRLFVPTYQFITGCIARMINLVTKVWRCLCQVTTWLGKAVRNIVTHIVHLLGSLLVATTERVRLAINLAMTHLVVPIINLVRGAVQVALTVAVEFAMRVSSVAIHVMERFLSLFMHVLRRFCDEIAFLLDWMWDRTARLAQSLLAKARDLSTMVLQMTTEVWRKFIGPALHHILGALQMALATLWKWLSLACRFALDRAAMPALRFCRRAGQALARASCDSLRAMSRILWYWFDCLVALSGRIHRRLRIIFSRYIYPPAKVLWNLIVSLVSAFLRKYWHLIPAGLVLNGSFLFAGAAITGGNGGGLLFARLQYALGSWSLLLIGCTLLHAVISSRGNLVSQYIIIDESILRHIDLHLGYVVSRVLMSGWHALTTVLKIVLNAIDFTIRKSFKALWRVLLHVHESVLRPLFQISKAALWRIWNYPYLSIIASLTVLGSLYLYHTGKIALNIPSSCCSIGPSSTFQFLFHTMPSNCMTASRAVHEKTLAPLERSVMAAYKHVYEPIVDVDVSSPSVALVCWILTVLVTKARARMRLKLFAVPVVVLYVTDVRVSAVMRAYCVSYVVWIGLSVLVDRYEDRERRRAGVAFDTYQGGRRRQRQSQFPSHSSTQKVTQSISVSDVGERIAFLQTECCICLESFEEGGGGNKSKLAELPCGHCFHEPCIHDWLLRCDNRRCPICRRATRRWDRVLEVVF